MFCYGDGSFVVPLIDQKIIMRCTCEKVAIESGISCHLHIGTVERSCNRWFKHKYFTLIAIKATHYEMLCSITSYMRCWFWNLKSVVLRIMHVLSVLPSHSLTPHHILHSPVVIASGNCVQAITRIGNYIFDKKKKLAWTQFIWLFLN